MTVLCLLFQGYIFSYVLKVEPSPMLSFVPLFPYIVHIYARRKMAWYYNRLLYWVPGVIALTLFDIAPFLF